jgi:hypothetical protein
VRNTAYLVPGYWQVGKAFTAFRGKAEEAYRLARGKNRYYRARGIYEHFPSLVEARAFQGSLNYLLDIMKKGIKGRPATSAVDKRLKAFMNAVDGDPEEAVRLIIERSWNFSDALKWFRKMAEQKGIE